MVTTEKRLIDANALKLKAWPEEMTGEGIVYVEDIDNFPTVDAVEVVRCKECENNGACSIQDAMNWTPRIGTESQFCSYGERKGHETD